MTQPILIAGGGIGGLATALALARRGVASLVLERSRMASPAGAGIQIGPNGMKVLADLGVAAALHPLLATPQSLRVFDGVRGERLTELPLGAWIAARHGAPYRTAHRADLETALARAAATYDAIVIRRPFEVVATRQTATGVAAHSATGDVAEGRALIGADGLRSQARAALALPRTPPPLTFSGWTAARALIPISEISPPFSEPHTGIWLGPDTHVVHYPVSAHRAVAFVVVLRRAAPPEQGVLTVAGDTLASIVGCTGTPDLAGVIRRASEWRQWPLYHLPPVRPWTRGRVTLLGDAAHPVLPYLAQGGVLALEDAVVLASCVVADKHDVPEAFLRYERLRWARARRVQKGSAWNGWVYHLKGPLAFARNLALKTADPERLMAGYDWMYGWSPPS